MAEVTEGEGEAKRTYSKVTFTAANVVNNKGTELRPAKTFTGEEYYEIELVRDDANAVVGAWIKNPAFGDKVTETVTDEASGTTATVVTGHTGFYTMKTDADGSFAFNDDNTAGLLPYVQFDADGNPVAAGDAAATDDTLAMASYRLTEPNLPEGHVLTVFHNGDKSSSPVWATNADSDAKRDIHRSALVDGYDTAIVTSYPQFAATDKNGAITGADGKPVEQDDKGLAEKTGFIVTANSSTPAANTPYTFSMEGVTYDVANQVSKREHVNTGLFKVPTSQITGIVWDDTESDDNTAPDGVRADDEQGLVGETVLATQWYYVPKGAAAFAQIKTGDDAGLVEWVAADGTKSTDDTAKASAMGAWVQNIGFGSDWVTTKATIVKDPTDITDQGKVVRIPVVSNGENRADARNKMGVVAVKTYAAGGAQKVVADAKEAAGYKLVDVVDGEYVFDNLPTAVVVLDANSGIDEYFLAAYRVELAAPKNYLKSGYVKGEQDPWHITAPHQPVTFADDDATAKGLAIDSDVPGTKAGVAGNADELDITDGAIKALYQSWPIQHRYAADGSVRANDGQVILAEVNNGKTDGIQASFADIPVSNAMDTADATTYQWTHPVVTEVAGDVGEIAPAYRAIGGYVWKDNDYKDGIYNLIPGTYEDMVNTGMTIELKNPEKQPVPDRPTRMYLRQWYYDPDRTNGGNANAEADAPADHWFPVPQGAFTEYGNDRDWSPTEATKAPFYYKTVTTRNKSVTGKEADSYYQFDDLPVRVFINGKEYLAGYTVAIRGNADFKPGNYEAQASDYLVKNNLTAPDYLVDQWNSKGKANVRGTSPFAYRYGPETFPLVRSQEFSSNGDIHTMDSVIVLAGSTTDDAKGARTGSTPYVVNSADKNGDAPLASFDLAFGKNETRMNGGYIVPPSAPIEGYIWEDANYDGVRQEDVYDKDGNLVSEGERGIGGVRIRLTKYYLDDTDKGNKNPDGTYERPDGTWKRTYSLDENGNRVLDPYYPFTTSYGTDPEEDLELGQYRTDLVPTSFKKPDAQKLGEASDREYLCGYTVAVADTNPADLYQQVPNEAIAGYTLTRPHVAGDLDVVVAAGDAEGMRTESDAFRYYTSEGLDALDSTTKAFGLVNRFIDMQDSVPAAGDTDKNAAFKNRVPAGRADGMVIVAHEAVESSTNDKTQKKYKGVTYDTDENVQVQQGGDGGFIKIPETSITGVVWDDSYSDQWAASNPVLDRAERERSYDGIYQPAFENGLPGRTVALTQWHYVTHDLWKSFALRHAHLVYNLLTKEDLEKLGIDKMDPIEAMKTIDKSTDATLELAWQLLYDRAEQGAAGDVRAARGDEGSLGFWVRTRAFGGDVTWKNTGTAENPDWERVVTYNPTKTETVRDGKVQYVINGDGDRTVTTGPLGLDYLGNVVDDLDPGTYAFYNLPTSWVGCGDEVHKEIELAPRYVGKADAADAGTTLVNADKATDYPAGSAPMYGDTYSLASYEVEVDGLAHDGSDVEANGTSWMLTRYHAGKADEVESDVASTDRFGVVNFAKYEGDGKTVRLGRTVTDRTVIAAEGDLEIAGTRTSVGDVDGEEHGGRIVVASEGVTEGENKTKLAHASDFARVSTEQLVRPDAPLYGVAAYDWLTVDMETVVVDSIPDGNGGAWVHNVPLPKVVQGGDMGMVHPTLQSISGVLWNDENNNGIQDVTFDEEGNVVEEEEALDGYEVTLERYYFDGANWVPDTTLWAAGGTASKAVTTTDHVLMERGTAKAKPTALGEDIVDVLTDTPDLYRSGTYRFDNLETAGLRTVNGTDQWVVYGYKVRVSDPRVTENELFKAKYQLTGAGYRENSDLTGDNALVEPDEYIVLLETVAEDGTTPDGLISHESNIVYAPASNNDDQTPNLELDEDGKPKLDANNKAQAKKLLTKEVGGKTLVAYDLMLGASRDHNDGGLIEPPAYAIDGYVWEDADYDGLYNYNTEERTTLTKDGTKDTEDFIEYGYNGKQVILKQWLYENGQWVQNENFGNDENVMAEKVADGVTEAKTDTLNPDSGTYKVRNEAGQMVDASPSERLTFTVPNSTYLGGGKVAVLTDDNENLKALAKDGVTELHDVSGYYLFDQLPTAVRTWNSTAKKYEYALASYTVEVNGEKAADGMSSLLVTTFEAETTAHDVVNSRVQPMVTAEEQKADTNTDGMAEVWSRYDTDNYPVFLDEQNIQTADEVHSDGSCTIKECETVEGEISKNNAAWRIVLAGAADGASWENQRTAYDWSEKKAQVNDEGKPVHDASGKPVMQTVAGTFDYDFAIGQNQNAMNAGFVPPDRSSLVGQAWYDEDYDGKNDSDTSDDRIDTDDRDKTEQGVEGLRVILTQYYFVPTYDHGNQLLEDEDNNVFYLDTTAHGEGNQYPSGELRLVENRGKNVVEGAGGKVYLVRSGRTYDYDALYKAGVRELKDSGYWVENTNFDGGFQYKDGEDAEAPETPVDSENPGETAGEANESGSRIIAEPAVSTASLARIALVAADGESTEVTDPGEETCTHESRAYTGNKNGKHNWTCDAEGCTGSAVNEDCSDGDGDGRCDGCGDCLHLHGRTCTYKDADVHTVTCADCDAALGEELHADANGNGVCDGCEADVCKHTELEWRDNFDNTHTSICKICKKETSTTAHVDAKHNDEAGTEGPDGRCDVCGGLIIEDHQLWTYTDKDGVYDFDNLPGYVLVSSEVDHPAAPGEDIDKVFQPYGVANANGTALSTSDLAALQKRPVSVGMIRQLSAAEIVSLSAGQVEEILADADMTAAYKARQAELAASDPSFTSATPYLTGYAIKVVDDSGEYVASRFHVEGAGAGDNSDLASFESSLTDNVNAENEKANEVYAVVAEKIADDADLTGGILSSAYAVRYLKTNYDLANRMYYKRAFDAGLTKQLPVLIDGNVWNDADSDGLMDEEEERIEGAVVRLVRYWYDETGIGYWEQVPGQTPGGDGSFESSGLDREEYDEITGMADPFKLGEGQTMTSEEQKAAADAMTAYIGELYASVAAMPEGAARAEAATKNLMKLNVLYHNHTEFLTSYTEIVPGEDEGTGGAGTGGDPATQAEGDGVGEGTGSEDAGEPAGIEERVIYSAWANANRDLTILVGAETPEEEKGVWRRDWTFTQDMLEDLTGRHDLSKDGLGTNYPYLPLTADEALAVADDDEKFFDQNGYEYVPGAGFDRTDENGHWQFLAYGTGTHQASSDSAAFKVLFSYRAEIVSYPDEDVWAPTLQHIGKTVNDWINSDFDDETQALKPNVEDAASHAGDYTLPATDNLNEAMRKAGDLIVLTRLADESESSTTSGAYATYASQPGGSEDVECEHVDEDTATTAADGLCDKCGLCLHEKDENGLCTVEGCQHIGMECCGTATPTEPGEDEGDGDEGDTPVIDVTKPEGGDTTQPSEGDGGEVETFTTRVMAASAVDARADTNTSTGNGTNTGNGIYSDDYVTEMLAWIATATQDDLDNMDQQRHDAIFGKHQKDAAGNLLYLETTIENGKEVEKVVTNETNVTTGEPNLPYYDNTGSQRLYEAYQARVASLVGDNQWSDLNWFSSLAHGYGLFRIAQAHIAGVVWQDDNYNGIQDAGENVRIPNVPVSLKRYWFGTDATGTGWHLDETFSQTTVSDGQGHWIFDNLDVAGKRMVGGKETTVLYGFEVTVDDLPKGYGVTHMNRGTAATDSDLNEDTKLIEPGDPQGGLIVLAQSSDRRDLVGNGAAYILGPNGTVWVISLSEDSDYNDTGLVPYALAAIAGVVFDDPEADGLQDDTAVAVPGQKVYLDRMVIDVDAVGFNGASYAPTALAAVEGQKVRSEDGWAEVASMETDVDGAYRFDGLPMVDGNDKPYLYRVRSYMPDGKEWVAINVGSDENNDSDWGEAANSVIGAGGRAGITPAMSVLGAFQTVRTTPNAYGQKFNLLVPYNWVPEDGRSVDLGMTGDADAWRTLVFTTPWGTRLFYVKLPQTGDELLPWMVGLALVAALGLVLAVAARRRDDDDEEEEETPEE
ncbi:SdrD B-like domain-containing protein [Adlercreutzia equolifaciens]|uniref:SdrD B-like domain-containing protein n=1 Tax=Adlercreutzia equolifaciens TaxID=446660 RepID=UPI003AF148CD